MTAAIRYLGLTAIRTRAPLMALAVCLFALVAAFGGERNEVGQTWGLTALLCCALAAWLVGAVLALEPDAQADMATAALGGQRPRSAMDLVGVGLVAIALTVAFVIVPVLVSELGRPQTFDRPLHPGDVVAAGVAHLCCATLGGTIGLLFGRRRITRRATSVAATVATLITLVAMSGLLGAAGGPVAVAQTLTDASPGTVDGAEIVAWLSCVALVLASLVGADQWSRRRA